jgi:hypothetical protein
MSLATSAPIHSPHDLAGEELGRFVVVVSTKDHVFDVWLFDKQQQTDAIKKVSIAIAPGATAQIGALVVAWQLEGMIFEDTG